MKKKLGNIFLEHNSLIFTEVNLIKSLRRVVYESNTEARELLLNNKRALKQFEKIKHF